MNHIVIKPGGKLVARAWRDGKWDDIDISGKAHKVLFERVEFADNLTVGDLAQLISQNPKLHDILGGWTQETINEILHGTPDPNEKGTIHYAEFYWVFEEDGNGRSIEGHLQPRFHGVGVDENNVATNWGLGLGNFANLAGLTVRLKPEVEICPGHAVTIRALKAKKAAPIRRRKADGFLLGQVLHELIHELTWHGGKAQREEFSKHLDEQVKAIREGTAGMSSMHTDEKGRTYFIDLQPVKKEDGTFGYVEVEGAERRYLGSGGRPKKHAKASANIEP